MEQECIDNKVLKIVADDVYEQIMEDKEIKEMFMEANKSGYGQEFVLDWIHETLSLLVLNISRDLKDEEYQEEANRIFNELEKEKENNDEIEIKYLNDIDSFEWAVINDDGRGFAKVCLGIKQTQEILDLVGPGTPPLTTEFFRLRECKRIDGDLWTGIVDSNPIFIYEVEAEEHVTFTASPNLYKGEKPKTLTKTKAENKKGNEKKMENKKVTPIHNTMVHETRDIVIQVFDCALEAFDSLFDEDNPDEKNNINYPIHVKDFEGYEDEDDIVGGLLSGEARTITKIYIKNLFEALSDDVVEMVGGYYDDFIEDMEAEMAKENKENEEN